MDKILDFVKNLLAKLKEFDAAEIIDTIKNFLAGILG